jgi:hypothetical protein
MKSGFISMAVTCALLSTSFVVLQAVMYARYHQDEQAIVRFQGVGPRLVARTADGSALVMQPHDRLYWTDDLQRPPTVLRA